MKRFFAFLLFITLILTACATPFDQIVSASSHFQGARQAQKGTNGAVQCPTWSRMEWCVLKAQTLIPDSDWSLWVPIVSYTVGRVQLRGASITESQNLEWFMEDGTPVQIDQMQEGIFYIYHLVGSSAGFYLTKK
jgi:hypothetical protein